MEAAASSSSAPSTSYPNLSLAQAVVTLSVDSVLAWLSAAVKSSSSYDSSSEDSHYSHSPTTTRASAAAPPYSSPPGKAAGGVDVVDAVLALMGATGPASSVGIEEAAALFEEVEEEATVEEARAAFAVFDRDGDGFIDAGELGSVLRSLGFLRSGDAECRRMIDAYDQDADGRIDFREFLNLMERTQQQQ